MSDPVPADREAIFTGQWADEARRYEDVIEELHKREESQDRIRKLLTAERDAARATISGPIRYWRERCQDLERDNARLREVVQAAGATIGRVKELHVRHDNDRDAEWCASDTMNWPCPTIKALEQP